MRRPDRLASVAAALRKNYLRGRMIGQNTQELTGRVAGGPYDPNLYELI